MLAANLGYSDIVGVLIESGADVNARADDGWTALQAAEMFGDPATLAALEAAGARE
jgi:ankyrin repeat protein